MDEYNRHYAAVHDGSASDFEHSVENYEKIYLKILRRYDRGARILDFGCGIGRFLYFLRELGYENCFGVDNSPSQVAVANNHGLPAYVIKDTQSIQGALQSDEKWSLIFLLDVLEHLPKRRQVGILSEFIDCLTPDGSLVLQVPNANWIFASRYRYIDWQHTTSYTAETLKFILLSAGFSQVEFHPFTFDRRIRFPWITDGHLWTRCLRHIVRLFWRVSAIAELGREGAHVSLDANWVVVARR